MTIVDKPDQHMSGLSFMLAMFAAIHGFDNTLMYSGTSLLRLGGLPYADLGEMDAKVHGAKALGFDIVI